mgnify:CR=1 FL=1
MGVSHTVTLRSIAISGTLTNRIAEGLWADAAVTIDGQEQELQRTAMGERSFTLDLPWGQSCTIALVEDGVLSKEWTLSARNREEIIIDNDLPETLNRDVMTELLESGLALSGKAEPNEEISVAFNDERESDLEILSFVDEDGTWKTMLSPSVLADLMDTEESLTVTVRYPGEDSLGSAACTFWVDTLPPDEASAEVKGNHVTLDGDTVVIVGEPDEQDVLVLSVGDGVTVTIDGIEVEDDGRLIPLQKVAGSEILLQTEDEAGNTSPSRYEIKHYSALQITGPTDMDAQIWKGVEITGIGEPDIPLCVSYTLGQNVETEPVELEIVSEEDGTWKAEYKLPPDLAGALTFCVQVWYEDYRDISEASRQWAMDLTRPELVQALVLIGGAEAVDLTAGGVFSYADGLDVILDAEGEGGQLYLSRSSGETILNGAQSLRGLEVGETLMLQVRDEFGNESEPVRILVDEASSITLDAIAQPILGLNSEMQFSGTGEPGWQVSAFFRKNGIVHPDAVGTATADDEGRWGMVFSAVDLELREGEDDAPMAMLFGYSSQSDMTEPAIFRFDSTIKLSVDLLIEGEQMVSGNIGEQAQVALFAENGETISEKTTGEDGAFVLELPFRAKAGQNFTLRAWDMFGNAAETAVNVEENREDRTLYIVSAIPEGDCAVIEGVALPDFDIEGWEKDALLVDSSAGEDGVFSLRFTELSDGEHLFTVRYADGLFAGEEAEIALKIDTVAPEITLPEEFGELDQILTGRVNEPVTVVVRTDSGDEVGTAENVSGEFQLDLADVYGETSLVVTATDANGNTSDGKKIVLLPSSRCVGMVVRPEPDTTLDWTKSFGVQGWILAAEDSDIERYSLELTDSREYTEIIPLAVMRDDKIPEDLFSKADQQIRLENAAYLTFAGEVHPKELAVGSVAVRLLGDGEPVDTPAWEDLQMEEWWKLDTGNAIRIHVIILAVLLIALCAAVVGLILVKRRIRTLRDAQIDQQSRASNLTIKKRS